MKIKSIKLKNEYGILKNEGYNFIGEGKYSPVYQVEYEETTPTGLTAKGTINLNGDDLEKVVELFNTLEDNLSKKYDMKESKDEKVDCKGKRSRLHNAETIYPYAKVRKAFEENFNSRNWKSDEEPDTSFNDEPESDKDELLNFTTNLAACLGVDDKFVDEIKKLFK